MPSHLTRHVFRRLLANEPLVHRGCLRRQAYSSVARPVGDAKRSHGQHGLPAVRWQQRRSFFNFNMFRKAKREVKEADMLPGMDRMMELERMQRMKARLPAPEDVGDALRAFFTAKFSKKQHLEDTEAQLALLSVRYLLGLGELRRQIGITPMKRILRVISRRPKQISDSQVELAKVLYEQIDSSNTRNYEESIKAYCLALCYAGQPVQARTLLLQHEGTIAKTSNEGVETTSSQHQSPVVEEDVSATDEVDPSLYAGLGARLWHAILSSAVRTGNDGEIARTLEAMHQRGIDSHQLVSRLLLDLAMRRNSLQAFHQRWKEYWSRASEEGVQNLEPTPTGQTVDQVLQWCVKTQNIDLGQDVVRDVMQENPPKPVWDAVFVWAAATGKGADEIGRMIDVMERSNERIKTRSQWRIPDSTTINALVECAVSKDDPYLAERFISFGRERGIEPTARTYVLQMDYRLRVNDVDGALSAYMNLQAMDLSSNEDVPAVNRLLVALCSSKHHDFDTIMNVAADLSDRRARFEPLAVSTLSILHLNRDELHDVIDLLNTHAFHYSSTERASIRDAIVSYCLDPTTPTSRSWDAYTIIRSIFDELARESRTELMSNFFERGRPDMAVHVFNHMRAHSRADTMPTVDTYVSAFLGTARLRDLESLEVVHNQLKLDYNINLNTYLRNALVIAYTKCAKPRKALQFWDDIVASREGPSYNSIHIALRACERSPFGDLKAKEIWDRLRKVNVELDGRMWASYVAALAGNGNVENAIATLEHADDKGEVDVDAFILGSLFGASLGQVKQAEVEAWAKARYPAQWADLEKVGVDEDEAGMRLFRIDRSVSP